MMATPRTNIFLLIAAALALSIVFAPLHAGAQAQKPDAQSAAAETHSERGKRLYEQGDAEGAVAELRLAAEERRTDADAWALLGLALNNAHKPTDARKAFEKALALRPDDARVHAGIALSLLLLDKQRDAESEIARALSLGPQSAEVHYTASVVFYRGGEFQHAADEGEAALRIRPDYSKAAALVGEALLGVYVAESERVAEQYPMPPNADEAARKLVLAKREEALEPVKSRMREAAERIEAFIKSQPTNPAAEGWREFAETLRVYGQTLQEGARPTVFRQAGVTRKPIITFKPEPGFTDEARNHKTYGVVRLRAVLAADGQVKHILVLKGLPYGLTEKAIAAARRIRFTPATVNGQPVSMFILLEYNFN